MQSNERLIEAIAIIRSYQENHHQPQPEPTQSQNEKKEIIHNNLIRNLAMHC